MQISLKNRSRYKQPFFSFCILDSRFFPPNYTFPAQLVDPGLNITINDDKYFDNFN